VAFIIQHRFERFVRIEEFRLDKRLTTQEKIQIM